MWKTSPLPIFFVQELALPTSLVFMVYMLSSGGAVLGYFLVGRSGASPKAKSYMLRMVLLRSFLIFSLVVTVNFVLPTTLLASFILVLLGFAYAFYHILTLSLSMELIPDRKSDLFDGPIGLGEASGAFFGSFLAENWVLSLSF